MLTRPHLVVHAIILAAANDGDTSIALGRRATPVQVRQRISLGRRHQLDLDDEVPIHLQARRCEAVPCCCRNRSERFICWLNTLTEDDSVCAPGVASLLCGRHAAPAQWSASSSNCTVSPRFIDPQAANGTHCICCEPSDSYCCCAGVTLANTLNSHTLHLRCMPASA